jgi:hypothetical protein
MAHRQTRRCAHHRFPHLPDLLLAPDYFLRWDTTRLVRRAAGGLAFGGAAAYLALLRTPSRSPFGNLPWGGGGLVRG